MGVVGEFNVHRPALVEAVLDLAPDLVAGQVWKE
jgi:hypothetical protein